MNKQQSVRLKAALTWALQDIVAITRKEGQQQVQRFELLDGSLDEQEAILNVAIQRLTVKVVRVEGKRKSYVRVRHELGMEKFEDVATSITILLPHLQDSNGRISLSSIIDTTRHPPRPRQLCTVLYMLEGTILIKSQDTATQRGYGGMRIKPSSSPSVGYLLYRPEQLCIAAPPEGLAQFIHGAELVVDSLRNDATKDNPVTVEQVRSGLQWLVNKRFEYCLTWIEHFCDRDLQVTINHMVYRTRHYIQGIGVPG